MKKVLALLLTVVIVFACSLIPVSAENNKIQPKLQAVIENSNPEDIVSVYISFSGYMKRKDDMPSWPDKIKAAQEYKEYIAERNKTIFAQVFDGLDVEILCDVFGNMVIANVKVSDIETIAKNDIVQDIDYYEELEQIPEGNDYLYYEEFIRQYPLASALIENYDEVYYHTDEHNQNDWTVIQAELQIQARDIDTYSVIGGRAVYLGLYPLTPFAYSYGLYDADKNQFLDIEDVDFEDYDGLYEIWQSLELSVAIEKLGDANGDGSMDIIDATCIQRLLATLMSKYDIAHNNADVDGDGDVTILDATRIQRALASLCNLDGTPVVDE